MKKAKKFIIALMSITILFAALMCISASAFYVSDNVKRFSVVDEYDGKIYCCYDEAVLGGVNEAVCTPLPKNIHNLEYIKSFTIHNGYIYYLTTHLGTGISYKSDIYRCDLDGSNNVYIADNAISFTECFIINDVLYYNKAIPVVENYGYAGYSNGGIVCVNLNTCEYKELYNEEVLLSHCDENYLYFNMGWQNTKYYRVNRDGTNRCNMSANDMEFSYDVLHYTHGYNAYDGGIYSYDWNRNSTWIANDLRIFTKKNGKTIFPGASPDRSTVVAVINDYVYYNEHFADPDLQYRNGSYLASANIYLSRTNGKSSNVIGWRYVS